MFKVGVSLLCLFPVLSLLTMLSHAMQGHTQPEDAQVAGLPQDRRRAARLSVTIGKESAMTEVRVHSLGLLERLSRSKPELSSAPRAA